MAVLNTFKLYEQLKTAFPPEAAEALIHVLSDVVESLQNTVTREDFSQLKALVADLGQAQKELAAAQKRTEERVEELAAAQKRTEERVEELAAAQKRTEERVEELAAAQKRTEDRLDHLEQTVKMGFLRVDMMFARGGSQAEAAFREGLRDILRAAGYTVEPYQGQDPEGYINHDPGRSYELDILVRNGVVVAVEIKSSAGSSDVMIFHRMVSLFERQTGRKVDRRVMVVVAPRPEVWEKAKQLGVVLCTDPDTVGEP